MRIRIAVTAVILAALAQATPMEALAADRTIQTCRGPATAIPPNQTFPLTCNVTSTLGGAQMVILPEMWVPGNGCIVTTDKPRVVMVGNNFGVSATFRNRCATGYQGSEGGLAWEIVAVVAQATPKQAPAAVRGAQITPKQALATDRTIQTCRGPATAIPPNQTFPLTCNVTSTLGGAQMVILPEMWVPGNGCIVTTDKPRVVMVGNNFGVSATFRNRCATGYQGSEGGLAWEIVRVGQ